MTNQLSHSVSDITVEQIETILKDCLIAVQGEAGGENQNSSISVAELDSLNVEIFLSEVEDRFVDIYPMIIETKDLRDNPTSQQFALFLFNKIKKGK